MKTWATLIYLKQEADGFMTAAHHYDCGYIRAFAEQRQMNLTQYVNTNLRTIFETADDLLSIENGTIIFCVDESNYLLSRMITEEIKRNEEKTFIIWFGEAADRYKASVNKEIAVDSLVTNQHAESIYRILSARSNNQGSLKEKTQTKYNHYISPYIAETIPIHEVTKTGTRFYRGTSDLKENEKANLKLIIEEFDLLQSYITSGQIQLLDENLLKSNQLFSMLLESIIENDYPFNLAGKVNIEKLTDGILEKMLHAKFDEIEIQIKSQNLSNVFRSVQHILKIANKFEVTINFVMQQSVKDSFTEENTFFKLYQMIIEHPSEKMTCRFEATHSEEMQENGVFRNLYPQKLANDMLLNFDYKQTSKDIQKLLINGYISYRTGYYDYRLDVGDVKHIEIQKDAIPSKAYCKLNKYAGINTSIINRINGKKQSDKNGKMYNLGDHLIRNIDEVYEDHLQAVPESQTYFSHLYQVYESEEQLNQLIIDDFPGDVDGRVLEIPYAKADNHNFNTEFNVIKVETPEDLQLFIKDVQHFEATGMFNHLYEVSSFLADGCRWGGPSQCSLTKLHRFHVNETEDILPCGGCNKAIGKLNDSMIDVIDTAFTITQEEEERRGCATCEVRDVCSKCSFLPDFMTANQYCTIRKSNNKINHYMEISNLIYTLSRTTSVFNRSNIHDIKVSGQSISHTFPNSIQGDSPDRVKQQMLLIYLDGTPFIVNGFNFRVSRITSILAFLFEGLLKNNDDEEMVYQITEVFQVGQKEAERYLKKAMNLFSQAGYLNEKDKRGVKA